MISAQNITFSYSSEETEKRILKNIDLNINNGEFVALLGQNGSGKSTLAKHFNAILLPQGGRVLVNNLDTADESHLWDIRSNTAMVFQNPDNQIVATVVEEDVAFAAENLGIPPAEIRQRVDNALEIVGMSQYKNYAPHLLSGGQKQRVAIAGVIAMRPQIIIFDEPTAMLDPQGRKEVMSCIESLNRDYGITVVLITHNMDEAVRAKRVVVLDRGNIVMDDVPQKIFSNVNQIKALGLDVPQVTYLAHLLKSRGIDIADGILTVDDCIAELEKYVNNGKKLKTHIF